MTATKPSDITGEIAAILRKAAKGKIPCVVASRGKPGFLTAYEILGLLPDDVRKRVIDERGLGAKGHGFPHAATTFVATAAKRVPNVTVELIDARGLTFPIGVAAVEAGVEKCGIYCLNAEDDFD